MFVVVWLWFMAYVATEIGFSTWLPPYATLVGLTSESDAALLTTVYYTAFTITRTLPFIFPRLLSSRSVLLGAQVGASGAMLVFALAPHSSALLWGCTAAFGAFEGPLWPAMMSLLPEDYGMQLRTTHTAAVLVAAKLGIAGANPYFSHLLSTSRGAALFPLSILAMMVVLGLLLALLLLVALPTSGLVLARGSRKLVEPLLVSS